MTCALLKERGGHEQASEDCSAPGEREVCNDGERFLWPPVLAGIALNDLHCFDMAVARTQLSCQGGIELDDNDACSRLDKGLREDAPTSADLDNELAPRDVGLGDEVSCEPLTSDEVLAGRTLTGCRRTTTDITIVIASRFYCYLSGREVSEWLPSRDQS